MRAIDELDLTQDPDPVIYIWEGYVWRLGHVLSMWRWCWERSALEICDRGIAF